MSSPLLFEMMDNHTSSSSPTSCFLFENTNGSVYPSDLVLTMIEDASTSPSSSSSSLSSSLNSSTNTNGSLSPSSSTHQSLGLPSTSPMSYPCCVFRCRPNSHPFQERCIPLNEPVKVGRAVARLKALTNNAIFDCKVLSRQHAKLWYENGKFLLQDTKSSNGTFVNNQRLGKCNEESAPFEIFSGDIVQFGVDVTENNRKTTHNCIIIEVKLFHSDGSEALPRSSNSQSLAQIKELDVNTQSLYQLAQYLQEAIHREQMLEQKLEYLQGVLRDTQRASNEGWQAIIDEDRLLARINALEDQIRVYHTKHPNEDAPKQEIVQLTQSHIKFEEESKIKLEKALLERADAVSRSKSFECSLQLAQDELKRFEEQNEQHKQEIQQLVQSVDEQRSLLVELELKLRDSQSRCTELESERQRIQSDFEDYYHRTNHLEELQQQQKALNNTNSKPIDQNGLNVIETRGRFRVHSSSKELIINNSNNEHTNSDETNNGEIEQEESHLGRPTILPEHDESQLEIHSDNEHAESPAIPYVKIDDTSAQLNEENSEANGESREENPIIENFHKSDDEEDNGPIVENHLVSPSTDQVNTSPTTSTVISSNIPSITDEPSSTDEEHNWTTEQKQIDLLREHFNETNDRLVSMEDAYRSEQERSRTLANQCDMLRDQLTDIRHRSNEKITNETKTKELIERQQNELDTLSKSIASKQSEHDQLLSVYLCFFLSCYLLIFFLFFCLLSW